MGLLTLVRWLLQRAFKFEPPFGPGSKLKRVPLKLKEKKCPTVIRVGVKIEKYKKVPSKLSGTRNVLLDSWKTQT